MFRSSSPKTKTEYAEWIITFLREDAKSYSDEPMQGYTWRNGSDCYIPEAGNFMVQKIYMGRSIEEALVKSNNRPEDGGGYSIEDLLDMIGEVKSVDQALKVILNYVSVPSEDHPWLEVCEFVF